MFDFDVGLALAGSLIVFLAFAFSLSNSSTLELFNRVHLFDVPRKDPVIR
jgi:hypothetical protein